MSKLTKALSEFNEHDVQAMDEALQKFFECRKHSGAGEHSPQLWAYTPILSFALLRSQAAVEKLTRVLIALTCVLASLAIIQVVLTV
jgi:hypothetical protein